MNTDLAGAVKLAQGVVDAVGDPGNVGVVVCPPYISLSEVSKVVQETPVGLGAQNMFFEDKGAFTGEVAASMLKSVGCDFVILGHSERRQYFGETDEGVNKKADKAIAEGLVPIICVGETLAQRKGGEEELVVRTQVEGALDGLFIGSADDIVIAYEPVWAIGTGETATPKQAQDMHAFIRALLVARYGEKTGKAIHILYGGSMKPDNAAELLAKQDVDGGLIGGAALKPDAFVAIVRAAQAQ